MHVPHQAGHAQPGGGQHQFGVVPQDDGGLAPAAFEQAPHRARGSQAIQSLCPGKVHGAQVVVARAFVRAERGGEGDVVPGVHQGADLSMPDPRVLRVVHHRDDKDVHGDLAVRNHPGKPPMSADAHMSSTVSDFGVMPLVSNTRAALFAMSSPSYSSWPCSTTTRSARPSAVSRSGSRVSTASSMFHVSTRGSWNWTFAPKPR